MLNYWASHITWPDHMHSTSKRVPSLCPCLLHTRLVACLRLLMRASSLQAIGCCKGCAVQSASSSVPSLWPSGLAGFWNLYAIQSYEVPRRICKIIEFDAFHPVTSWVIREGSCASLCGAQVNMLGQCGVRMGWIGQSQNKINQEHSGAFWICTRHA